MSQIRLSEEEFNSVKDAQSDGTSSVVIAKELELRLPAVNVAFKFDSYAKYESQWDEHLKDFPQTEVEEEPEPKKDLLVTPQSRGYFRTTLGVSENLQQDTKGALKMSVRGLWTLIGFLEQRKAELERQIRSMESYIQRGIGLIEDEIEM